jgi:hypothetical protein
MSTLIHQRCYNHALREAVARCPSCARFYCRECVTEHEDRVLCAECVRKLPAGARSGAGRLSAILRVLQFGCATLAAWLFFYWIGQVLLSIDPAFHEGTMWKEKWWTE